MLKNALELLKTEYNKCINIVENDYFYALFANEKWRHSMQVAGAGNYIVKRVGWLKNKSPQYLEMVKTAVLLHDVCRFQEIVNLYHKQKGYDHGIEGALFLKNIPEFNDIRIWLPIKHHGHLIEKLYEDEEYKNIADKNLQKEVELICFIIRDADKIANLHMLANEENLRLLFLGDINDKSAENTSISEDSRISFLQKQTTPRHAENTSADRMLSYLSWYFDINYQCAIDFCNGLNVTATLENMFKEICQDDHKNEYCNLFEQFLQSHKFLS